MKYIPLLHGILLLFYINVDLRFHRHLKLYNRKEGKALRLRSGQGLMIVGFSNEDRKFRRLEVEGCEIGGLDKSSLSAERKSIGKGRAIGKE